MDVGTVVGVVVGSCVGPGVGVVVGWGVGGVVGTADGSGDGGVVGTEVGTFVGAGVGLGRGTRVGFGVGARRGSSGALYVGRFVGADVGTRVGFGVGPGEGTAVVGAGVGASVCETSKSTYVHWQKSVIFSRQSPFVGCTVGAGVGDTDSVGMPVGSDVRAIVGVALIGIDGSLVGYSEMVGVG